MKEHYHITGYKKKIKETSLILVPMFPGVAED